MIAIIGATAEEILHHRISDLQNWRCNRSSIKPDLKVLVAACREVVEAILPLVASSVGPNIYEATRNFGDLKAVADKAAATLNSLGESYQNRLRPIADHTLA